MCTASLFGPSKALSHLAHDSFCKSRAWLHSEDDKPFSSAGCGFLSTPKILITVHASPYMHFH